MAYKYKIIVVDDHAIVRHGVRLLLSSQPDLEVVGESHNGKELLDLCRTLTPDLILLDLSLDDRNGLDLVKKVTKNYPDVRILIFSALEESNYAVRALKSGAWGFVSKEQAATDLVNAIRVVLQGQKYISPTTSQFLANWLVDAEQSPPHINLSEREFQTFQSIAAGLKTAEIAEKMNISVKTVSMYRQRALVKIGLRNNSELIAYAIKNNLTLDSSPPSRARLSSLIIRQQDCLGDTPFQGHYTWPFPLPKQGPISTADPRFQRPINTNNCDVRAKTGPLNWHNSSGVTFGRRQRS